MSESEPAGRAATVKPGDVVWYVPHEGHAHDRDHNGSPLWQWAHTAGPREGQPVDPRAAAGLTRPEPSGSHQTAQGHPVRPHRPLRPWPATVDAVHPDGSADLTVPHPSGCYALQYPRVPRAAAGPPHTYHTTEGE